MIVWLDAQISPIMAPWINEQFTVDCLPLVDLGLDRATDIQIFEAARRAGATVMSKDRDFVDLLMAYGPPPSVIWLTCGNCSNASLKQILSTTLALAFELLTNGDSLVQIA